jgi:hypothetical protein
MISERAKEAAAYAAGWALLVVITLGCSAALIFMGVRFMWRLAE